MRPILEQLPVAFIDRVQTSMTISQTMDAFQTITVSTSMNFRNRINFLPLGVRTPIQMLRFRNTASQDWSPPGIGRSEELDFCNCWYSLFNYLGYWLFRFLMPE
jgi:hypothetical protein